MTDTIAAIATPPATGAIGIVRLSGPGARAVADRVFLPGMHADPPLLSSLAPRCAHYGRILDTDGRLLDKALALVFPAPHSYTGEDCSVTADCAFCTACWRSASKRAPGRLKPENSPNAPF